MNWLRHLFLFITIVIALFPITPMYQSGILIMVWLIIAITNGIVQKRASWKSDFWTFLIFSSPFLFYLITAYLYPEPATTFKYIERKLSLIIFPLGFYLYAPALNLKQRRYVTMGFEYAMVLIALLITYDLADFLYQNLRTFEISAEFSWEFRTKVEQLIYMHPTYITIMFLFAVFLKIDRLFTGKKPLKPLVLLLELIQIAIILTCCLLLSARGPILAFAFGIAGYFMLLNWKRTLIAFVIGIPMLIFVFSNVPAIGNRFKELGKFEDNIQSVETLNSTTIRQAIYLCSAEALEEGWLFGKGLPGTQNKLNSCYEQFKDKSLRQLEFNTHNQYLEVWISGGLVGILLFGFMLLYSCRLAFIRKDKTYTFFLILICICFLTENLLARQHGIVFYAFFNALLSFRHDNLD